ncbi:aminoacyl-tRNA hydrolase [Nitrospina sp. 32_T5]|uniref:aminoacyl-tRNA hydrolase n=1 Tax=unclassified Nitrospina TaxID=2638683 RepID=UPI003F95B69F
MYLILGLGNPGPQYELTRHNVGFMVVDNLAEKHRIPLNQHKHRSLYGQGKIEGRPVVIAKPMTYMNESGRAAQALLNAWNIPPERMVVVHDDIDLVLGKIKRKFQGGDAGQKGVLSCIERLATDRFGRIRVGIGRPDNKHEIVDYVLSPFSEGEMEPLNHMIEEAVERVEAILTEIETQANQTTEENTE